MRTVRMWASLPASAIGRGDQNVIQRWIIALASTRLLSAISRRILPSLDRLALGSAVADRLLPR